MQETIPFSSDDQASDIQLHRESAEFFGPGLKQVMVTRDHRLDHNSIILVSPKVQRGNRVQYMDSSYAALVDLDIEDKSILKRGERLALLPNEIFPAMPGEVAVFPYDWHKKLHQKYLETGKLPKGVMILKVPKSLITEYEEVVDDDGAEANKMLPESKKKAFNLLERIRNILRK